MPLPDWLFWSVFAALLLCGHTARVGVYLGRFAAAAALSALAALARPVPVDAQLHLFLFASLCLLLEARRSRKGGADPAA